MIIKYKTLVFNKKLYIVFGIILLVVVIILTNIAAGIRANETNHENNRTTLTSDVKYSLVTSDGRTRTYIIHIPSSYGENKSPVPLLLVFHGGQNNAERFRAQTGFDTKSDEAGFIVAYPNGLGLEGDPNGLGPVGGTWNGGPCCDYPMENNVDDVGFISTLIEQLSQKLNIDSNRIYATGFSNGALFVSRLACELSEKIAAIAPASGGAYWAPCEPEYPVSVIGFKEVNLDYFFTKSHLSEKHLWNKNDCDTDFLIELKPFFYHKINEVTVMRKTFFNCRGNTERVFYRIGGGAHEWPDVDLSFNNTDDAQHPSSISDIIWDFFKNHPGLD